MAEPILVADIGGTNARFALAERSDEAISIREARTLRAADFETIREAAGAYLESVLAKPKRGCFATAGPIVDGKVDFTNSHWVLRTSDIAGPLNLDQFHIVNDFYALAAGVRYLADDAFVEVKSGTPYRKAPQLVIGPGTGLGQALIVPTKTDEVIVATEGGHITFAPRTAEEFEIMKFIEREHSRVSVERLLSGDGLVNIYRALCAIEGVQRVSQQAREITNAATTGEHPIAVKAVDMFCMILGRVAGDAVLATGARGGVILGGGILPKIKEIFLKSAFTARFTDKGRMSGYVGEVPVKMIVADGAALCGAAAALEESA